MNIYGCGSTHGESAPVLQATLPAAGLGQVLGAAPCLWGWGQPWWALCAPPSVTVGHRRSPLTCLGRDCGVTEVVTSQLRCHVPLASSRGVCRAGVSRCWWWHRHRAAQLL